MSPILSFLRDDTFLYHMWRSVWCTYITVASILNVFRLKNIFDNDINGDIKRHLYYDNATVFNIYVVLCCVIIDLIIFYFKRKFYRLHLLIHHIIVIIFCALSQIVLSPHHYYCNLFMCSEVVSSILILAYIGKNSKDKTFYKIYLVLYLLLTFFVRGLIWGTLIKEAYLYNSRLICILGIMPLMILDCIWVNQCADGLNK